MRRHGNELMRKGRRIGVGSIYKRLMLRAAYRVMEAISEGKGRATKNPES